VKKATGESVMIARHINGFLNEYVPSQKSSSSHTLKSYRYALALYIGFLDTEKQISAESLCGRCFDRPVIEEWLKWLMDKRAGILKGVFKIPWEQGNLPSISL